jgi:hypothetical protein
MEDLTCGWEVMLVGSQEGIHSKDSIFVINVSEITVQQSEWRSIIFACSSRIEKTTGNQKEV